MICISVCPGQWGRWAAERLQCASCGWNGGAHQIGSYAARLSGGTKGAAGSSGAALGCTLSPNCIYNTIQFTQYPLYIIFPSLIFDRMFSVYLQEHKKKLTKMLGLQKEIHDHLSNLPDLTQLPDVTGGLAPLPSAGDLFNTLHWALSRTPTPTRFEQKRWVNKA